MYIICCSGTLSRRNARVGARVVDDGWLLFGVHHVTRDQYIVRERLVYFVEDTNVYSSLLVTPVTTFVSREPVLSHAPSTRKKLMTNTRFFFFQQLHEQFYFYDSAHKVSFILFSLLFENIQ